MPQQYGSGASGSIAIREVVYFFKVFGTGGVLHNRQLAELCEKEEWVASCIQCIL